MKSIRRGVVLAVAALLPALSLGAQESQRTEVAPRTPGEFTLGELVAASSAVGQGVPVWSPDGRTITVAGRGRLWAVPAEGGEPEALPLEGASSPAWSPDGSRMAFLAPTPQGNEIWMWEPDGSAEPRLLTRLGSRIDFFSWSPDGTRLAFHGYRYGSPDVFTVEVESGRVRRLTSDRLWEVYPTWTPDSRHVVFVRMDERWVDHDVWVVEAQGGEPRLVVQDQEFFDYRRGQEFGPAQVQPGGDLVLFRSHRSGWLNQWVVPLSGGEPRPLWSEEADHNAQKPFRGYGAWSPDGGRVAFTSNLNGTQVLRVADVETGDVRTLVEPEMGVVANAAWSPDGSSIAYTFDTPQAPEDLWVVDVASGERRRLTWSLDDSGLEEALFVPEKVFYPSSDGLTIPSYLYRPPGAASHEPVPAIVWIHGGPTSQFDDSWRRHWQVHYYVKHGYAVLLPNIRGSSGYGQEFELLNRGCWGRCDMEDVEAAVAYLDELPWVDASRAAVTGTSYGGFMSMAATTFAPDLFRASFPTLTGYGDWGRAYEEFFNLAEVKLLDYELGPLPENRDTYRWTSPIHYVDRIRTPLLLVGGEGETPMARFAAQVARHYKPVQYLGFPGDPGSAANRLVWMPRTLEFLEMHLRHLEAGGGVGPSEHPESRP
ncbi:MAG: S9 family peptidase [Gemmatimonadales bacterium]|nr:MAG: S9 family peptidase [Gemmatimonadales bacterium]